MVAPIHRRVGVDTVVPSLTAVACPNFKGPDVHRRAGDIGNADALTERGRLRRLLLTAACGTRFRLYSI
jgi:hypothetical protein